MNRNKQTFLNYFVSRSREGVLVFPFSNTKKLIHRHLVTTDKYRLLLFCAPTVETFVIKLFSSVIDVGTFVRNVTINNTIFRNSNIRIINRTI